jgi:hypothetical protein
MTHERLEVRKEKAELDFFRLAGRGSLARACARCGMRRGAPPFRGMSPRSSAIAPGSASTLSGISVLKGQSEEQCYFFL